MFFFFEEKPISLVLWIPRQTAVCQLTLALISPPTQCCLSIQVERVQCPSVPNV